MKTALMIALMMTISAAAKAQVSFESNTENAVGQLKQLMKIEKLAPAAPAAVAQALPAISGQCQLGGSTVTLLPVDPASTNGVFAVGTAANGYVVSASGFGTDTVYLTAGNVGLTRLPAKAFMSGTPLSLDVYVENPNSTAKNKMDWLICQLQTK